MNALLKIAVAFCVSLVSARADTEWKGRSVRDEIRPEFRLITNAASATELIRSFPVHGGSYYRFSAHRKLENVSSPRRSGRVRILWHDANGKPVRHDEIGAKSYAGNEKPITEPEYPVEGALESDGWMELSGVYHVPAGATQAIVELYLRWAPHAVAVWRDISLTETPAPETRKVRLATIHYRPHGGKSAMDSCEPSSR